MENHTTHIRRVYRRPWQQGAAANPGKVVGVRPPKATQRYKEAFRCCRHTRDLPELYVLAAVEYFQTTTYYGFNVVDGLLFCKTQFLPRLKSRVSWRRFYETL